MTDRYTSLYALRPREVIIDRSALLYIVHGFWLESYSGKNGERAPQEEQNGASLISVAECRKKSRGPLVFGFLAAKKPYSSIATLGHITVSCLFILTQPSPHCSAMEVVNLFISFRFYIRLQRFMYDFRVLRGDVVEEGRGTSVGATNVLTHVLTNSRLQQAIPRALLLATEAHPPQDLYALQDSSSEDDIASNPQ